MTTLSKFVSRENLQEGDEVKGKVNKDQSKYKLFYVGNQKKRHLCFRAMIAILNGKKPAYVSPDKQRDTLIEGII